MQEIKIRNIAVLGHLGSGKTTLVESLYAIDGKEKGSIEKGTTVSDYQSEEIAHKQSIKSAIIPVNYDGYRLNLIDIPGSDDFVYEAIGAIQVVKGAILVIDASKGVEVETKKHWNMLRKRNIPTIIFVNKMDKENVHFDQLLESIRSELGKNAIPFCYPMGHDESFDGFINVVTLKARKYNGKECVDDEIYPDKRAHVFELHNQMVEAVASTSDELLEKFFQGEQITKEEVNKGLRTGVLNGELIPVLVGSATKNIGVHTLIRMLIDYLPNPSDLKPIEGVNQDNKPVARKTLVEEPFSAYVFKTIVDPYQGVSNIFKVISGKLHVGDEVFIPELNHTEKIQSLYHVCGKKVEGIPEVTAGDIALTTKLEGLKTSMSLCDTKNIIKFNKTEYPTAVYFKSIEPKSKVDEEKINNVLSKLMFEDPVIELKRNHETKQLLLGTLGLGHLNYIIERLKNTYKLELQISKPKIVYRETITASAEAEGRYVKQSGGSGFYGIVNMKFQPGIANTFKEEVFGGAIPKNYFPAIEKGFNEACLEGPLAGYPVIGVEAILLDGKYHAVDSNELAFKMAAILAFKEAYMHCKPILLEPIMEMIVTSSPDDVGQILSDLNTRRAKIISIDFNSVGDQKITVHVPESEIEEYVNDLRSLTQGSAYFNRRFFSYEEVPSYLAEKILKKQ